MKNNEIRVVTLDYDKNIYLSPSRGTDHLTKMLKTAKNCEVHCVLNKTLCDLRDAQWNFRPTPGYKFKTVRWNLQVSAFFEDYAATNSFDKGPRLRALLRKRQIPDNKESKQRAIESDLFETSAPSEDSDALFKDLEASALYDDGFMLDDPYVPDFGGKTPKPHIRDEVMKIHKLKQVQSKAAARKQAMSHKGRGKQGVTFPREVEHRHDDEQYSGESESSNEEIFSTQKSAASNKRKIQSIPRPESIVKKSRKSDKEKSIHASRDMQKTIKKRSIVVLDLGTRSLDADKITTVKIDVLRMEEPNSLERVRDTDSEWVDVLVNTFKNRTSSMVAPICCIVSELKDPGEFDVNRKHEYTYRTIGGNHSRTAFARLLSTISEDTDTYITSKWRYSFLWIKTFFYLFLMFQIP